LTAIIAGFEIGPRVGKAMGGENMLLNGWHSGGIVSPFPAAVAAGVVLGLTSDQHYHALGIAGTQACGLMAAQYGSMVKRTHHAKGAQSGLYAALLARDGFTGIEDVFEQPYGGYCSTFSHKPDQFHLPALSDGLGQTWETMYTIIKGYAAKMGNHSPIDAVGQLATEHGLKAEDVDAISVAVTEQNVLGCGWYPYEPKGLTAAQLHTGFCVAMRLIEGDVFVEQMIEENIARPDLVTLANRVRSVRSIERERKSNEYRLGADVEVKLKNGRMLKKTVDFPPGSVQRPFSAEQMTAKFRKLARKALPDAQVARVEEVVWGLDQLSSVTPLTNALRKGHTDGARSA
jgi:2-methylcitrate dehydratase PrpD